MIYVLTGLNHALLRARLAELIASDGGDVEYRDASEISSSELREWCAARSLFIQQRLRIVENAASAKDTWQALGECLSLIDEEDTLVIVEPTLDKRTQTYKLLRTQATVEQFDMIPEGQSARVVAWATTRASQQGARLSHAQIELLCDRALVADGQSPKRVYDQSSLLRAIDALAVCESIDDDMIDAVLPASPHANIFELFRLMLTSPDEAHLHCQALRQTEPYMVLALLATQLQQLCALVLADIPAAQVAKDIGAHPFVISKLAPLAAQCSRQELTQIIELLARADDRLKSSSIDPWRIMEALPYEIAAIRSA